MACRLFDVFYFADGVNAACLFLRMTANCMLVVVLACIGGGGFEL